MARTFCSQRVYRMRKSKSFDVTSEPGDLLALTVFWHGLKMYLVEYSVSRNLAKGDSKEK